MDTASPSTSTSTVANPNNEHPYDIFINQGSDTKKKFASYLYRRLLRHGFHVFSDMNMNELHQGHKLDSQTEAAIKSASVHVAIFSPGYAESCWCLEELLLMLETGATIIPVFYNVYPPELTWTEGLYAEALHKHKQKERYDPALLEKWRNALCRVARISGFELEECNGDEGELLEKVVERVLENVHHRHYDVFICQRGCDTKKTFASYLYRRLRRHRFQVFLDKEELRKGDNLAHQIEAAINSASIFVVIFSPRFAQSIWCLEELRLMLMSDRAMILPVFYKVKPSVLRCTEGQKGLYAQALLKHEQKQRYNPQTNEEEQRYDPATLQQWRNALSRVADISGFELEIYKGDEGELLEEVVKFVVSNRVTKGFSLDVAKYPTGLDAKLSDFGETVLSQQEKHSGKPQIVGIVGLGGVGKTTLAKKLYNRCWYRYSRSSFLFSVRDYAHRGLLETLQSELLKSLTGLDKAIYSIDEGIEILKKHLSSSQVLVVLDDVDNVNQLDAFLPIQTVVSSDSFILITTRDKAVLERSGIKEESIYKLNGLEAQASRELFCLHAFCHPYPPPGFESMVDEFIEACDGLPLSLKVLGALVCGKDDQYWKDTLHRLQQYPPNEIQQILNNSYDALDCEERQIFLDIACFFIGENRDKALKLFKLWYGSGWTASVGFQNLLNKCLVELDSKNNIHMHNHLRVMGRKIAEGSQQPLRLCCSAQNIDDLLQQPYVPREVRGIMVVPTARRPVYRDGYFDIDVECLHSKMSWFKRTSGELLGNSSMKCLDRLLNTGDGFHGVGLLDVEDGDMERILRRVQSPNVIWIRWYRCPYSFLPSWIPMQNLRYLEVGGGVLERLWQGRSQAPLHLRELLIFAPLLSIPSSIGYLKHVERIVVDCPREQGHINLENLPDEFCHLQSLKALVLRNFRKLKSLPNSFGNLVNLEHLDLQLANSLERLPDSFGNLIRLKYLDLSFCLKLNLPSETLGNISTLEHLNLSGCTKIEVLPLQLAYQSSLAELCLVDTNLKELPSAVGNLRYLEVLELGGPELHSLPPWLGELQKLKKLQLSWSPELKHLPDSVGRLTQLAELTVYCPLSELPFKKVEEQREIYDSWYERQISDDSWYEGEISDDSWYGEFMPGLQYFKMRGTEISEISFGEGFCPNLQVLQIWDCRNLKEITLRNVRNLQVLEICDCRNLKKIEGLMGLYKLHKLEIRRCNEVEELQDVEHCSWLNELYVSECPKLLLEEEVAQRVMGDN